MIYFRNNFFALGLLFFAFTFPPAWGWAGEVQESVCVECHRDQEEILKEVVVEWETSIHKSAGISCHDCHGGDPTSYEDAMLEEAGFLGKPKKEDIPGFCAKCHSDPKRMRLYNLRTDQHAFYKESVHGKRLVNQKDQKVATCVDCHGSHSIFSKKDPRSPVYRPNIIKTCAKCHSNRDYMEEYGIPTNQYENYLKSYHGKLLLEKNDPRAPTCVDCHGNHGASPPGAREVADVCGNCHSVTAEFYSQGPHKRTLKEEKKPRCIDCHGKHFIPFPTAGKFTGHGANDCRSCHDPGSVAYEAGLKLKEMLEGAENAIEKGRTMVSGLKKKGGTGFEISRLSDKLDEANTSLVKTIAMTHTMDMPRLEKRTGEINEGAQWVLGEITSIYRELKTRYLGLVITWLFLLLLIWALNEKRKTLKF